MAAAASDPQARDWRDWGSLGAGPAELIAERALSNDYVDFLRFRAACTAWRECCAALDRRFHPRRWVMLPRRYSSSYDAHGRRRRCFLDFATGGRIHLSLPDDLHHCFVLGRAAEGLLVLCRKDTYAVQLLNPLTGQTADLPDASTLLGLSLCPSWRRERVHDMDSTLRKLKLHGAGLVDGSTLMLHFGYFSLAIAKPGDERWTRLKFTDKVFAALPFQGRIYCVTTKNISVVETMADLPPELAVAVDDGELDDPDVYLRDRTCLVSNDGELVLAYRAWSTGEPFVQGRYRMFRVKLGARKLVPLVRFNGQAFFSGAYRYISWFLPGYPSLSSLTLCTCATTRGQISQKFLVLIFTVDASSTTLTRRILLAIYRAMSVLCKTEYN